MNNKLRMVLIAILFAALIISAYLAYNFLSEKYEGGPDAQLRSGQAPETAQTADGSSPSENADVAPDNENYSAQAEDGNAGQNESEEKKYAAPDFTVYDANGNEVKLSDFLGKPVVLNFWASWCSPCKDEMPHFDEVYKERKDDVVFMMVNLSDGQRETQETAQKFLDGKGYKFPVYFDTKLNAATTYGIYSIPVTLFIDSAGYIMTGYLGAIDKKTLENAVNLLVE